MQMQVGNVSVQNTDDMHVIRSHCKIKPVLQHW